MILSQALNIVAQKNPTAIAVLDLGKELSFADLKKRVGQLSFLYQAEIGHGSRVAFLSQNNLSVILSFFAFSNAGILSYFVNLKDSDEKVIRELKDLEITHIAISGDQLSRANELIRTSGRSLTIVEIEKKKGGEYDPSFSPPPEHPLKETDQVLALKMSEFGEDQKYILFTHKQVYIAANSIKKHYHVGPNDRFFTTLSWAYPFALIHGMLFPLLAGATCAIDPQSDPNEQKEYVDYLSKYKINRFVNVPKYFYHLLAICKVAKYTLPNVKSITVGMGQIPLALRKTFELLKIPVVHCYGRVENIWTIAMGDTENPSPVENIQYRPLPGYKYKVMDENGDEIDTEEAREGPLAVMGGAVMTAFFHPDEAAAAKATKQTIRGGWFYTGEVARLEGKEPESLTITPLGRAEDVIRDGHEYFLSEPVDEFAKQMKGVSDAAGFVRIVKGKPALACAVVRVGKALDEKEVLDFLKAKLGWKAPTSVHFTDEIPKDEFDHVNRGALQRIFSLA